MNISEKIFVLFAMLFCHIVDDYYLQGILAQMKQKRWWDNNADDYKYRNDYKMALAEHAFSWAFMVSLPIVACYFLLGKTELLFLVAIFTMLNTAIHAYIDNQKANKLKINLIQDQTIHFAQIGVTWGALIVFL